MKLWQNFHVNTIIHFKGFLSMKNNADHIETTMCPTSTHEAVIMTVTVNLKPTLLTGKPVKLETVFSITKVMVVFTATQNKTSKIIDSIHWINIF